MIPKYQLILVLTNVLLINGEWIEMPQFSDNSKVYKLSDYNSFQNEYFNDDQKTVSDYDAETITRLLNDFGRTDGNISHVVSSSDTKDSIQYIETATVSNFNVPEESMHKHDDEDEEDFTEILSSDAEFSTDSPILSTLELPVEESSGSTTATPILPDINSAGGSFDKAKYANETEENAERFQDYLPMEMLHKVHQTLKSQPSTLKGKFRFLKQFETNLMAEIETRLGNALAPVRRTRGAHDNWDHDEEMGFPSLEGALMAISFLTFAVYLVRLVMLLFRNATNTTATATTILFRRKRRTMDTLDKKTEEILNYLNTFDGK